MRLITFLTIINDGLPKRECHLSEDGLTALRTGLLDMDEVDEIDVRKSCHGCLILKEKRTWGEILKKHDYQKQDDEQIVDFCFIVVHEEYF